MKLQIHPNLKWFNSRCMLPTSTVSTVMSLFNTGDTTKTLLFSTLLKNSNNMYTLYIHASHTCVDHRCKTNSKFLVKQTSLLLVEDIKNIN